MVVHSALVAVSTTSTTKWKITTINRKEHITAIEVTQGASVPLSHFISDDTVDFCSVVSHLSLLPFEIRLWYAIVLFDD